MGKICLEIDSGHGGKDAGAVNGSRHEADDNLKIGLRLGKVLKANGVDVAYTRKTDVYDSPSEKADMGNKSGADYFICIHRNSSANKSAKGAEVLVRTVEGKKYKMAKAIQANLVEKGFVNRGVKTVDDLAVLNQTDMPALLIEVGFISNKEDNALLDEKFYSVVNAIARGIVETLGMEFKTITELKED